MKTHSRSSQMTSDQQQRHPIRGRCRRTLAPSWLTPLLSSLLLASSCQGAVRQGMPGGGNAVRDAGDALGQKYNIWDRSVLEHAPGSSAFLPLKHRLVELEGYKFGSPRYQAAKWHMARRRLEDFNRAASGGDLALLSMGGSVINGTFFVQLGMGSPQQIMHVTFDTGSSIFWTNCDCISCPSSSSIITLNSYRPGASTTSQQVPCNAQCTDLINQNAGAFFCSGATCNFQVRYGDHSTANGPVLQDVVSFPSSSTSGGYISSQVFFGCGRNQSGMLVNAKGAMDGLMGMGMLPDSVLSQMAASKVLPHAFSFCLSSTDSQGSHAILGRGPAPTTLITTPLVQNPAEAQGLQVSYYYVGLQQILVGTTVVQGSAQLGDINPSNGQGGVIVDSGTTLTNLPAGVFNSLIDALNSVSPDAQFSLDAQNSASYPCAILSSQDLSAFPDIIMDFGGGKQWHVAPSSYLVLLGYGPFQYKYCVGIMSQAAGLPSAIIGESWLTDSFVQIDVEASTIGWARLDCSSGAYFSKGATAVPKAPSSGGVVAGPPGPDGSIVNTINGWFNNSDSQRHASWQFLLMSVLWTSSLLLMSL